ncbi:hypothetical protein ABZ397_29450, partial [Streptomyces sp. NPDC005876]
MEQSGTSALLKGAVRDLAAGVASALRSGGHGPAGDLPSGAGAGARPGPGLSLNTINQQKYQKQFLVFLLCLV